jgi:hypothetical protein
MGSIIASCGHDVSDRERFTLITMDFRNNYESETIDRCLSSGVYCEDCAVLYESWGIVLHNEFEENQWLSGKTDYPEPPKNFLFENDEIL